jgi:hypothetical protein
LVKAAAFFLLLASAAAALRPASVELQRGENEVEVRIGGRPFTTYYFSEQVAKPYLMPLGTASGIVISRSFPAANHVTEADQKSYYFEPHQRPLYFGHGNVDGLNFWAEQAFDGFYHGHSRQAYGRMKLIALEEPARGSDSSGIQARFSLLAPSGRVIAEETQSFEFQGDDKRRIIDCEFVVYANHGPVTFGDTKEGTFALRLNAELSAPHDHMINSAGAQGEPAIWGKQADWVAYSGVVSGKEVTVVVFDSPKSFRHPTTWHARAYGLLAANPFGAREFTKDPQRDGSWTVPEGQSLAFRYRVLIYEGRLSPQRISDLYQQYAGASK